MMKLLFIFWFLFALMIGWLIMMDVFVGIPVHKSVENVFNPFLVMKTAELVIFYSIIGIAVFLIARHYYRRYHH
ncbi:hypothetical protein SAMN05421736_12372 [Evansella caseinilytica]|uniref:Uncharacterized protein n=1 Tax=Evansella caseinilytica TaxID=1503961 RepID=A0A1H3UNP8_9BACI|nr:hypothetical protein [Evansella caseinilytica]SDZ63671.1 hypothetical protein SAMN05421736_12372 [Evansella caseinilytica]